MTDVSNIRADEYAQFVESALRKRGEIIPAKPPVALTSIEKLLESANRAFPLLTIHREEINPNVCHIGRVVGVGNGKVSLLEIGPDAKWDKQPTNYQLIEITRVNFGGDYEGALHLVGGAPIMG